MLGLFDVIRPTLGVYFVQGLARCVETKISIQRIQVGCFYTITFENHYVFRKVKIFKYKYKTFCKKTQ